MNAEKTIKKHAGIIGNNFIKQAVEKGKPLQHNNTKVNNVKRKIEKQFLRQ